MALALLSLLRVLRAHASSTPNEFPSATPSQQAVLRSRFSSSRTRYHPPPTLSSSSADFPPPAKPCRSPGDRCPSPPVSPSWAERSVFSFSASGQSGAPANHARINRKGREDRPASVANTPLGRAHRRENG